MIGEWYLNPHRTACARRGMSLIGLEWGTVCVPRLRVGVHTIDRGDRPIDRSIDRSSSSVDDDDDDDDDDGDASPERGVVARRRGDGGDATDATDAGRRGDDANERGHHG